MVAFSDLEKVDTLSHSCGDDGDILNNIKRSFNSIKDLTEIKDYVYTEVRQQQLIGALKLAKAWDRVI